MHELSCFFFLPKHRSYNVSETEQLIDFVKHKRDFTRDYLAGTDKPVIEDLSYIGC